MFRSKKGISIFSIIFIAIILTITITIFYLLYLGRAENVFKIAVDTLSKSLSDSLEDIRSDEVISILDNNSFEAKSNISINANFNSLTNLQDRKIEELINNSSIDVTTKYNKDNEYMEQNIIYSYNGSKGMEVTTYSDNNNSYLYLNDVFDKYISISDSTGMESMMFNSVELTENDYKYIISKIREEFNKISLKPYVTTLKNQEVTIGSETIKTKKVTLLIGKMIQEGACDDMIKELNSDDKFIDILIRFINNKEYDTRDKVKQLINNSFESFKKSNDVNSKISIYTKGILNRPVMLEIGDDKGNILQFTDYKTKEQDFKVLVRENAIDVLNLTSKETSKNNYNINITSKDNEFNTLSCNVNGVILDNEMNLKYDLNANIGNLLQKQQINLSGELKTKIVYNNVDKSANGMLEFSLNSDKMGTLSLKLTNDIKVSTESIQMPFIYYTVGASELTDAEYEKILYNIIKKYPAIGEIVNYLSTSII